MRQKYKKILFAGTATTLAGVLGIGAMLTSHLSVQASPEMMPGIETIVEETSKEAPFRILEIVDDPKEAEIGWYVSGQEPYIKLYSYTYTDKNNISHTMTFSTLEEGLAKLPTKTLRQEFANNFTYQRDAQGNIIKDENGNKIVTSTFKDVSYASYTGIQGTNEEDYPLSYTPYQEKYHLEQGDAEGEWNRIDFGEVRTEKIKGHYVKNPTGTGDYTKEEQLYYPVRENNLPDDITDKEGLFRENIKNFLPSESPEGGGNAPYHLVFQEVDNAEFNNNLKDLYDPAKQDQVTNNPIWQAYDYTKKWNANGDATDGDCYGYGYYENKYEALTTAIADNILPDVPVPSNPEKKPIHTFPGEKPVISVNGKEVSGIYVPQSKLFDSGTITVPSAEEPIIENEISVNPGSSSGFGEGNVSGQEPGSDVFGDGEINAAEFSDDTFSSGTANSGEDFSFEETNPSEQTSGAGQEEVFSASLEEEPVITEEEVLFGYADIVAAGFQGNPYIYLAEQIPDFPFYKYRQLGDLKLVKQKAVSYSKDKPYTPDVNSDLNISINKNGQYLYWTQDKLNPGNWISQELFLVTGRQPVAYENLQFLPDGTVLNSNYYYKVVESYFCCKKSEINQGETLKPEHYKFYGWYYPVYPVNEPQYIPEEVAPTHYISDAIYKLTPGKGDYDFVPDENGKEYLVEVDHLFYRGGYKNHDWLKKYVFNLKESTDPSKPSEWDKFAIDVTTVTSAEFEGKFVNQTTTMAFTDELAPAGADADFTDAETVPVEPLISESQETALTGELFTDTAQMEDDAFISGEGTASEVNQINESFEEEPAFETSQNEATFTSKITPAEPVKLSDFDLIYINGTLVTASATALAKSGIPCIINESKLQQLAGGVNELRNAFSSFIKDTDADSHYVTQYVYVFKNTLLEAGNSGIKPDGLLNLQFHQDFNPISDGTIPNDKIEGFEEILEYIDSENQYRQLGATQDKDGNYVDGAGNIIELLKMNLSQARAIEYILNFKHRRPLNKKDTINVLEIQPAKSNGQLTKNQVLRWLGYDPIEATVTACCEEKSGEEGGRQGHTKFIADGKLNTYWHSQYNGGNHANKSNHWITISYNHPVILNSLHYTPRFYGENKTANGEIFKFNLIFDDNSRIENCTWTQEPGKNYESYVLQQPKENVTSVEIEIIEAHDNGNKSKKYASCVELETEYSDIQSQASKYPKVNVTTMTSSEFVGHIEDINTKYDMIYWGDDETNLNQYANFRPDSYLYYHIGKADRAKGELQGLMNQDYEGNGVNLSKLEGEIGLVRGSGNDITLQQKEKLMDFVHSGYPVVLGDNLINDTGVIDESRVDNSSYVYQFLKEAITYQNVMTKETASKSTNLAFYMKISKPKIVFKDNGIPVSAIKDINGPSNQYLQGDGLVYSFHIEDDAAISPASTLYNCELYLDLNCDGNFSPKNERIKDIEIRQNGELLSRNSSGCYELKAGKENIYTVTRTVPQEYVKLITWKLEVSNNQNNYIRTSELGYTKRGRNHATSSVPEIKVLQIHPTKPGKDTVGLGDEGNTWDLTDQDFLKYFDVVQNEFHITIKGITIDNYNAIYNNVTKELQGFEYAGFNNLNDYDMLIIGFGDGEAYGNIDEDGVQGIEEFIKTGKSVIFAHDTTSSSVVKRNAKDTHQVGMWKGWAYNLNMKLRSVMGMDRYGITGSQKAPDSSEQISSILKRASSLASTDKTIWDLIKNSAPDMAYEAGTGQTQTVGQTHGFTNAKLRIATKNHDGLADIQTKVTKVNEGAITKYPYKIDDMPGFDVAGTHAQYYQAALEADTDGDKCNDVVVWYCLDGGTYAESPNDVRNNYYIYSNKNVFYTGVGHRLVKEKGSEEEKKLFVNTIVAAYRASSVNPKIEFLDSYDMDAPEQEVVYYMTDQESYAKEPGNIINEGQEFYFRVKDNNLISTGIEADGERKMNIDLYISDSNGGTVEGINEKVSHLPETTVLYQKTGKDTEAQVTHVSSGYVYRFRLQDMFEYLMDANNHYKNGVKLYAKVSTKYMYFGEEITASAVDQIDLCQRHLFDLD